MKRLSLSVLDADNIIKKLYDAESGETNNDTIKRVKKALCEIIKNDLTERQKQMVVLYYYKGMTMEQIADTLDINASTVCRTLKAARKNIYDRIKYYFL